MRRAKVSKNEIIDIETEHGPELVCYSNEGLPKPVAMIVCLCGATFKSDASSWAEVGGDFDDHLSEAQKESK
jgi:hypothetical protein